MSKPLAGIPFYFLLQYDTDHARIWQNQADSKIVIDHTHKSLAVFLQKKKEFSQNLEGLCALYSCVSADIACFEKCYPPLYQEKDVVVRHHYAAAHALAEDRLLLAKIREVIDKL